MQGLIISHVSKRKIEEATSLKKANKKGICWEKNLMKWFVLKDSKCWKNDLYTKVRVSMLFILLVCWFKFSCSDTPIFFLVNSHLSLASQAYKVLIILDDSFFSTLVGSQFKE